MGLFDWLRPRGSQPAAERAPQRPRAGTVSGRPYFASGLGGTQRTLAPDLSFRLLEQLYLNVPVMGRAIDILASLVGVPEIEGASDRKTKDLTAWRDNVEFGYRVGRGLGAFVRDHTSQALLWGYAVGEAEIAPARNDVIRLHSYISPSVVFRVDPLGQTQLVQPNRIGGEVILDPVRAFSSTHNSRGGNPMGQSLFFALPSLSEAWVEMQRAQQAANRRILNPRFHINVEMPEGLPDPTGAVAGEMMSEFESSWTDGTRSLVERGQVQDYVTVGKVTVKIVGSEGQAMEFEINHRVLTEDLVSVTGIPPFMYGFSWATTERMSTEQAQALVATVDCIRFAIEPALRHVIDLRQLLSGGKGDYTLCWPPINLRDAVETARAELITHQAAIAHAEYATKLWALGILDQEDVAELLTGKRVVKKPMDEPPALPAASQPQQDPAAEPQGNRPPPAGGRRDMALHERNGA